MKKENLMTIKKWAIILLVFPILMVLIGKILILNGFSQIVSNYENENTKLIMKFLYLLGLGIFFICGGFSDKISKKLFSSKRDLSEQKKAYFYYIIYMFSFINIISICGFMGFLICGNFVWLATFSLINFLSLLSYFPTEKRFVKKIEKFNF
ncbi:MAG: hypothetical protein N2589_06485 [bacterium]|nr:hypothetical protein [bacterium]